MGKRNPHAKAHRHHTSQARMLGNLLLIGVNILLRIKNVAFVRNGHL